MPEGTRLVRIARISDEGQVWVTLLSGNQPILTRLTSTFRAQARRLKGALVGQTAVALFDRSSSEHPVLLDLVVEDGEESVGARLIAQEPVEARVDGRGVVIEGYERIELRCGKASITLTSAGKVLIQGAYVSTRSSGVNRIRGAAVKIN